MAGNAGPLVMGEYLEGVQEYLRLALMDLQHLRDQCEESELATEPVCHLFRCPRLQVLKGLIQESVEVLERTKSSFRSKELGSLRKRLEQVLEELD